MIRRKKWFYLPLTFAFLCSTATALNMNTDSYLEAQKSEAEELDGHISLDVSHSDSGKLSGTYWLNDEISLIIETQRGPAVDHNVIDRDDIAPDYIVYVRMTLPSGQVVYEDYQADLPVVSSASDSFSQPASDELHDLTNNDLQPVDFKVISDAASEFYEAIDIATFTSEAMVLRAISTHALDVLKTDPNSGQHSVTNRADRATCSGSGCDGKDPSSTGCSSSAFTAAYVSISWWWSQGLYLRYSSTCKTNWGKWSGSIPTSTTVHVDRWSPKKTYSHSHNGTVNWSDMVYCADGECLARARVDYSGGSSYTTAWY